jgi:hypothetical protein
MRRPVVKMSPRRLSLNPCRRTTPNPLTPTLFREGAPLKSPLPLGEGKGKGKGVFFSPSALTPAFSRGERESIGIPTDRFSTKRLEGRRDDAAQRRTSEIRRFAAASALALLAFAGSSCESWSNRNAPVDPKPAPYEQLQDVGVGGQPTTRGARPVTGSATSPHKAYELFRSAIKERDFDAYWNLLSRPTQKNFQGRADDLKARVLSNARPAQKDLDLLHVLGLSPSDVAKVNGKMYLTGSLTQTSLVSPRELDDAIRPEYDHEVTSGDNAKVYVRLDGDLQATPMKMVREGGVWRIDLTRRSSD